MIVDRFVAVDRRIRLIRNKKNKGVSLTRKKALQKARGEWIAVLDSDDLWEHNKLERQLAVAYGKKASLIFTGSGFMDSRGKRINCSYMFLKC